MRIEAFDRGVLMTRVGVDAPLEDPRYERIHETAAGGIWKRIR